MSNLDNRISNADQLLTNDIDKFCESVTDFYSNASKPILDIIIYMYRLTTNIGAKVCFKNHSLIHLFMNVEKLKTKQRKRCYQWIFVFLFVYFTDTVDINVVSIYIWCIFNTFTKANRTFNGPRTKIRRWLQICKQPFDHKFRRGLFAIRWIRPFDLFTQCIFFY